MESLQGLTQILGNGFFPIIISGVLCWYVYRKDQDAQKRDQAHKEEISELRKSIDNNTQVVQRLLDRMDGEVNGKA